MNAIRHPLVSVMIPYYNCEQYIAETIASVEAQHYPNIEIIIVDDGSREESAAFLAGLLESKPSIRLSTQNNQGVAAARNHAARLAKGEYFLFLDADDQILPDYIQKSVAVLESNPNCKLVYPLAEFFDAKEGTWQLPPYEGIKSLLTGNCFPSSVSMHRAADFKALGGFDENLTTHEDWDFWIRLLSGGGKVYQIPEVLFRYRKRRDGSSLIDSLEHNRKQKQGDLQHVYEKHSSLFLQHELGYWNHLQTLAQNWHLTADNKKLQEQSAADQKHNRQLQTDLFKALQKADTLQQESTDLRQQLDSFRQERNKLEQTITELNNRIQHEVRIFAKYKGLLTVKTFKPLIKTEQAISSANRYRKLFRDLIKEKGSISKAYQTCRHTYKTSGIRAVKILLRQQKLDFETIEALSIDNARDGFVILATKHTRYIAQLFNDALKKVDIQSTILLDIPKEGYSNKWHIVICPQMFESLPPHYLAFQMEQSVSSRWFTDAYFQRLHRAAHVFDYSITNIAYLQEHRFPFKQLHYLPVGMLPSINQNQNQSQDFEFDVAFYGDPSCERRQLFLQKLSEGFSVKVISEVFGDELHDLLKKAKIVVNIHYYENALLETTRVYECLSLNKLVVSEQGSDQHEHSELENIVDFVGIDDIEAMIARIDYWLNHADEFDTRLQAIADFQQQPDKFQFYFYRFLLSQDLIDFETFYRLCSNYIKPQGDFWCLSLPESIDRRQDFDRDNHYDIWVFPGLRHNIGWVGSGLSYKFMMRVAEDLRLSQVTICEDDVLFNNAFEQRYTHIKQTLSATNEPWDVYSGLIADLSEKTDIFQSSIHSDKENFYSINRLVSMVFNIYNYSVYSKIYSWDEDDRLSHNTIDRYIEQHGGIQGVITSPFLVGHKEDLFSTLWGTQNTMYKEMIARSQNLLDKKIAELDQG